MARVTITASETIHVDRPPDEVFDYTQDYSTRPEWDASIASAEVIGEDPRRVRAEVRGVGTMVIEYKLFRRGERTSAAFTETDSRFFSGGGGSWSYVAAAGGTDWTQTNTMEFKSWLVGQLLAPLARRNLSSGMRKSMARAKEIMESAERN
jgi:uncharacterized membrane protein